MLSGQQTNFEGLPSFCSARVLILGVGNILFGDDGFGPEVVEILIRDFDIPEDIYVMDVGTGVRKLLFTLALSETHPAEIIIVDAVDWGREIGRVLEVQVADLPTTKIDDFSLHQVPTSNMLRELQDSCGVRVSILACDVGFIEQMIDPGLSPVVRQAALIASRKIAERCSFQYYS